MALASLLRALNRRIGGASAQVPAPVAELSPKARKDALKTIARARRQLHVIERQLERGLLIRQEDASAGERLDRLAQTLEFEAAALHVADALRHGLRRERPVPHLVVRDVLPPAVIEAARAAIPARVFFDTARGGCEVVTVPPSVAPVVSIATWTFIGDLVERAVVPTLVDMFRGSLEQPPPALPRRRRDFTVLHARLFRWETGGRRETDTPPHVIVVVLNVGDREHRLELRDASTELEVALPPASAVAYLDVTGQGRAASVTTGQSVPAYTYEIAIGAHRAVRHVRQGQSERP